MFRPSTMGCCVDGATFLLRIVDDRESRVSFVEIRNDDDDTKNKKTTVAPVIVVISLGLSHVEIKRHEVLAQHAHQNSALKHTACRATRTQRTIKRVARAEVYARTARHAQTAHERHACMHAITRRHLRANTASCCCAGVETPTPTKSRFAIFNCANEKSSRRTTTTTRTRDKAVFSNDAKQ